MSWVRFSAAVALTSIALVAAVVAIGGFAVGNALASNLPVAAMQAGVGGGFGDFKGQLPPQLAGLKDVPDDQRFAHFKGVQVNLTDKDGAPATIVVTPGVVTAVNSGSLTIAGNDGAAHTYALDPQTMQHGKTLANGQQVVVVTMNNTGPALAAFAVDHNGWGHGPGGPPWGRR
jgi:hypothetical protein